MWCVCVCVCAYLHLCQVNASPSLNVKTVHAYPQTAEEAQELWAERGMKVCADI